MSSVLLLFSSNVSFLLNLVSPNIVSEEFGPVSGNRLIHQESDELQDTRNLRDEDLRNLAQVLTLFRELKKK